MSLSTVERTVEKSGETLKSLRINISYTNHAKFKAIAASVGKPMNVAIQDAIDLWVQKQLTGG